MIIKLHVLNLKCSRCEYYVCEQLMKIKGVHSAKVNSTADEIDLILENGDVLDVVKFKLNSMGYPLYGEPNSVMKKSKAYVSCMLGWMSEKQNRPGEFVEVNNQKENQN